MKKVKMRKGMALFWIVSLLSLTVQAGQEGNGGGGIILGGIPMTFGSAKIYVASPIPETVDTVPEIQMVIDRLLSLQSRPMRWVPYLEPSEDRRYYRVDKNHFDETARKRLTSEYARLVKQSSDAITLFAVTDINFRDKSTTYLLPDFFKLSSVEKQAILFHEAIWAITWGDYTYENAVQSELAFQEFLEGPGDLRAELKLLRGSALGDPHAQMSLAFQIDEQSGNFSPRLRGGKILARDLLGVNFFRCLLTDEPPYNVYKRKSEGCLKAAKDDLYSISRAYPNSELVKEVRNYVNRTSGFYDFVRVFDADDDDRWCPSHKYASQEGLRESAMDFEFQLVEGGTLSLTGSYKCNGKSKPFSRTF